MRLRVFVRAAAPSVASQFAAPGREEMRTFLTGLSLYFVLFQQSSAFHGKQNACPVPCGSFTISFTGDLIGRYLDGFDRCFVHLHL